VFRCLHCLDSSPLAEGSDCLTINEVSRSRFLGGTDIRAGFLGPRGKNGKVAPALEDPSLSVRAYTYCLYGYRSAPELQLAAFR